MFKDLFFLKVENFYFFHFYHNVDVVFEMHLTQIKLLSATDTTGLVDFFHYCVSIFVNSYSREIVNLFFNHYAVEYHNVETIVIITMEYADMYQYNIYRVNVVNHTVKYNKDRNTTNKVVVK